MLGGFDIMKTKTCGKGEKPAAGKKTKVNMKESLIPVRIKRHRDKNGGHHHIIVEDFDNKHVSVGLTTRKTKGENSTRKNYKCEVNPLGGSGESYLRRQGMVARKQEYDKQEKKGGLCPQKIMK